jgi:hypothetical protein
MARKLHANFFFVIVRVRFVTSAMTIQSDGIE